MGIEQSDLWISLRDREHWREGFTKDDLARDIAERLEAAVPESAIGISQPIQMRTNELVAGVRSDVGVILYGPDLGALQRLGDAIADVVREVPGAVDVRVEPVEGLRYLRIEPDRAKLARYGLSVADVNLAAEAMAVGHEAGVVLEGDRRFAIRIKVDSVGPRDLETLGAMPLESNDASIVQLADVATLSLVDGPAAINREDQSRRTIVEFNVRGRDLVSTVDDARAALEARLDRPAGYRMEWGGTFEQYLSARQRLAVVVPMALGLISFLLWSAFGSVRVAAVVFLNVPFAIVGGALALWLRDLPFSISAGIGFIALFGVAVLNGLVLVSVAHEREAEGVSPGVAIASAAELRLRPVLMTALVAGFGFLPMAISTAPGSEVQRPLATVVIGGLVTATLLTLVVLPVVYRLVMRRRGDVPSTT
jgi:heavy metal efflux system protein